MTLGAVPAVRFGEGRRPEVVTQVQVAEFDGPLGLLLSLIEARQLDVLTVPLGALADAYLDALATLEVDRLGHISSFVAVASQLILIKSRAMLPRQADPGARPRWPMKVPTPRLSCVLASSSIAPIGMPGCAWSRTPFGASGSSAANRGSPGRPAWPERSRPTRRLSIRRFSSRR